MKTENEKRTEYVSLRMTPAEKKRFQTNADKYGMSYSTYARDKILKGPQRHKALRSSLCTSLVETSKCIDDLKHIIDSTDSDVVPKSILVPIVEKAEKGCNQAWKNFV